MSEGYIPNLKIPDEIQAKRETLKTQLTRIAGQIAELEKAHQTDYENNPDWIRLQGQWTDTTEVLQRLERALVDGMRAVLQGGSPRRQLQESSPLVWTDVDVDEDRANLMFSILAGRGKTNPELQTLYTKVRDAVRNYHSARSIDSAAAQADVKTAVDRFLGVANDALFGSSGARKQQNDYDNYIESLRNRLERDSDR